MTRNAFITGGNSGIGKEMARALAGQGYRVIIASRDLAKSQAAVDDIKTIQPTAEIEAMALDLGDFDDIDRFAPELLAKMPVIDVFMMNSGLYANPLRKLPNGFEAMIGIMHFGHFRLTRHILGAIKAASQGRIVVTSSVGHNGGKIDESSFKDPSMHWHPFFGYAQAKLANLLFTRELARRLAGTNVTVNAFHPGAVTTGIWAEMPGWHQKIIGLFLIDAIKGADTAVWLATSAEGGRYSGEYFVRRKLKSGSGISRDEALAARLWELSEQAM